jgi:hypothetical protein
MAKKKYPDEPSQDDPERPTHRPHGREHEVHKEILARRMRGGAEPTAEKYAKALKEWQQLPGSVVRPPSDIKKEPDESPESAKPQTPKPENPDKK